MLLSNVVVMIAFMRITITGFQELDMRPGIGKKTAQRIIENRPVGSIEDLKKSPASKQKRSRKSPHRSNCRGMYPAPAISSSQQAIPAIAQIDRCVINYIADRAIKSSNNASYETMTSRVICSQIRNNLMLK
jgi:hypothetical protein